MKLQYKLMLFSLVAMLAVPMFLIGPNGKPMMALDDWIPDSEMLSNVTEKVKGILDSGSIRPSSELNSELNSELSSGSSSVSSFDSRGGSSNGKIYSWRDDKGTMHFSEDPPPSHISNAKVRNLPKQINVVQAVEMPKEEGRSLGGGYNSQEKGGFKLAFPTTVPLKDIPKMIDDAKAIQGLADQRAAIMEQL